MPPTEGVRAEQGVQPKIYIVYRRNALYYGEVPALAAAMQARGSEVRTHIFEATDDREADQKTIASWLLEHKEELAGYELLADRTSDPSELTWVQPDIPETLKAAGMRKRLFTLDHIFEQGAFLAVTNGEARDLKGEDWTETSSGPDLRRSEEMFVAVVQQLLAKDAPEKIVVATNSLSDHNPFQVEYVAGRSREDKRQASEKAAATIKEWLVKAGFPAERIEIADKAMGDIARVVRDEQEEQGESKNKTWYFGDRHSYGGQAAYTNYYTMPDGIFLMPVGNLVKIALEKGLIEIPPEVYRKKIADVTERLIEESQEKAEA